MKSAHEQLAIILPSNPAAYSVLMLCGLSQSFRLQQAPRYFTEDAELRYADLNNRDGSLII